MGTIGSYPPETTIDDADKFLMQDAATGFAKYAAASEMQKKFLASGAVPWVTWTPVWTNVTVGNGVVTAKYTQIGKTVHFYVHLLAGTTSSASGSGITISYPVAAHADYATSDRMPIGLFEYEDSGVTNYPGIVIISAGTLNLMNLIVSGANVRWSALGVALSTGDAIQVSGTYQAA